MFMLNNKFPIQVISLQWFCGWHNSIKYCYILVLGTAPFCLYYFLNTYKHIINQILTHPGINLAPFCLNLLPQLQHPTWTCFIVPTIFFSCCQSFSIGLRSGDCAGNGRTLKSLSLNQFWAFLQVCFGPLSCWKMISSAFLPDLFEDHLPNGHVELTIHPPINPDTPWHQSCPILPQPSPTTPTSHMDMFHSPNHFF